MNVSVSITDLPVFTRLEHLFAGLKKAGADGVEVVTGVKSRWRWGRIKYLSEKYELPVLSIHQPPWSVLNYFFDEGNIRIAVELLGVRTFVFHPITRYSFADEGMKQYLKRLSEMQKKYDVTIALENMPSLIRKRFAKHLLPLHADTLSIPQIEKAIKTYDLSFNLDISHINVSEPQKEKWFESIYPRIKNIHLSSFNSQRDHLPLYMGDFNTKSFLTELKRRKYKGLVTLEIFYPRMVKFTNYDYEAMRKSIEIVKGI